MAVVKVPQNGTLTLRVQTGLNAAGSPVYAKRNMTGVKPAASIDDVYAVGTALAELQKYPLADIVLTESNNLVSQ
ncbi:MAG TPA: DUF1659 domain-containing protein [Patescibacteria group bacterium]|nr:DUF1659 domain-containing protein [Patescibacteria group bacterium]